MAIDTQSKRRAVHGYTGTLVPPVADGTVDDVDRPHMVGLFPRVDSISETSSLTSGFYLVD